MKKISVYLLGVAAALSLAACSPTKVDPAPSSSSAAEEITAPGETVSAGGAEDKVPDPTAPDVSIVSIYSVTDGSISESMDEVGELSAQELVAKLVEYGVLDESAEVISYEEEGSGLQTGPGVSEEDNGSNPKIGTLNISAGAASGIDQSMAVEAVVRTFVENMTLDEFVLQVNGAAY